MDHDLSAHSSSSPYPQHSREPSTLDSNQSAAPALSLQDYLASVMSSGTISAALPPPAASGYEAFASPPADEQQNAQPVNFADILAEFTLAQNAFSPDTSGNRGGGDSSAESTSPNLAPTNGNRSDKTGSQQEEQQPAPAAQAKSAQEILLEQLKALYPAAPAPTPAAPSHHAQPPPPCQQQQQHSSQVEAHPSPHSQHGSTYAPSPSSSSSHGVQLGAEMQAQLQQWLAQSMPTNHSNTTSQVPTPTGPPAAASAHMHHYHHQSGSAGFHAPAHLQQQHPQHHSASPTGYSLPQSPGVATFAHTHSAPSSLHASPMPFYAGTPHEQQQQHYPGSSPATPLGHGHPAASSSFHPHPPAMVNMPGAAAAAALAALSPLLVGMQPNSPGGGSTVQAQLNALQMLVTANAQAQAHAQIQANADVGLHGQQQQQQPVVEHQQATPLQQPSNPQTPFDIRTSAPGTASSSYRETDYMFSPLMSPAMTPHSAFTNASSLPPSVGPVPLVTPSDCFPPLTSPALGPQMFGSDHAAAHQHHQHRHRNSLQGLVDGVGALSTQLPPGSPNGSYYSPRLGPSDPVPNSTGTGPGSGRRGASSGRSKTRPSPLIKPTADSGLEKRRRKTQSAASTPGEKRSSGQKSATASPFLEPATRFTGATIARGGERASSTFSGASSSHANGASPGEGGSAPSVETSANGSGGSAGGIDTPSPVDLASSVQYHHQPLVAPGGLREAATLANAAISQAGAPETESMGPPPLPPTALNPITPATFMNFASDFDMNGLSSLSPALQAVQNDHFDPVSSALSSLQNSPALLPQAVQSAAPALSMPPPITEESFRAPPQPSASGKASKVRKTPSARASPALKPVDSKGKGKASANSEKSAGAAGSSRAKGGSTKPAKIAPSPKIGPTRPGFTPDALRPTRGSGKGKDDLDAGIEELPLPPPATSDIEITPMSKNDKELLPDNRRSSHKVAEQKRRDSLKLCFDELRRILPPILPYTDEQDRRPGDGNVGGQRHGEIDPDNPNKGVSKVALLRRSNEYLGILRERIDRRDRAISSLRSQLSQLREQFGMEELGEDEEEVPGLDLDLDNLDKEEKQAGNLAFYEDLDFDEKVMTGEITRRISTSSRRPSVSGAAAAPPTEPKPSRAGTRRSKRQQTADDMDVEA